MNQRYGENLELYERGLLAFRSADWQTAISVFEQLESLEGPSPELDQLLADARLKAEIDRVDLPAAQPAKQPRKTKSRAMRPLLFGLVGLAIVALAIFVLPKQNIAPMTMITDVIQPLVAAATERTNTAVQVFTSQPVTGTLELRWVDGIPAQAAAPNVEIILDASGSMLARAGEERRIVVAQRALRTLVEQMPEQTNVALRVYGRRRTNDCSDTELVQPLGPLDRAGLIGQIEASQPVPEARTPLALSLQAAAEDMRDAQGDVLILVVSDGNDTCEGNPVQAVADLRAAHPNIHVSVVGFSVGPEEWRKQLQDAAAQGGGTYFDAATPEQLTAAISSAAAIGVRVLAPDGSEIAQGTIGTPMTLPAGQYSVVVNGNEQAPKAIEIHGTATAVLEAYQQDNAVLLRSADQQP